MTFLESATLLIPALTGIAITISDGNLDTLKNFEKQYCFSPQLQPVYTAAGLASFFERHSDGTVYEVLEPMGSWSIAFQVQKRWVLIGPYVEDDWNERSARSLLAELGASETMCAPFKSYRCKLPIARREYMLKTAMLVVQHGSGLPSPPMVKTIHTKVGQFHSSPSFLGAYEEIQVIHRRYAIEDRFILAVSQGDTETAIRLMKEQNEASAGLRFISDDMQDQIAVAAIARTMIRIGAKQAELSPVLIDSISQEYAQRMQRTSTMHELNYLTVKMTEEICTQVRTIRENKRSLPVRRAVEYITANLSDPMTIGDIARAAGVERHKLTRDFQQEMGMTIKQYLRETRCNLAADLLGDSKVSVQEIAAYIGYPDVNYFTKVFKTYAAAKGGLKMLTKNIASEYGQYNIQCNGIGPGYIATPQTAPLREPQPDGSKHPFDQFILAKTPANRWGEASDLGGPAVFLASPASDFVNGHILYVDGGILAYIGKQPTGE